MRVFLDTRDLIPILEGRGLCSVDELRVVLERGEHKLVVSPTVVFELAAPLVTAGSSTVVTKQLNDLETLPLDFIGDCRIARLELLEAMDAFNEGRSYLHVDPYVARLDAAIPDSGPAPTAAYISHGVAETVFTIWQVDPSALRRQQRLMDRFATILARDRATASPPKLKDHFPETVCRELVLEGLSGSTNCRDLGAWIYADPGRCPARRIKFEVYHQLRKNVADEPERSDLGDFAHLQCLPYVDLMTLDARMTTYVRQGTRGWAHDPANRLCKDLDEVVARLA